MKRFFVIACHYSGDAKPVRVEVSKVDCFRYEAADASVAEMAGWLS